MVRREGDAKAICAKRLNTTAARRMIAKAGSMVEAGRLPLWGRTEMFKKASLSGFAKLQKDGETGTHTTPIGKCRNRGVEDGDVALYEYFCRSGAAPVFPGAALRPEFPPSELYLFAILGATRMTSGGARGYPGPRIHHISRSRILPAGAEGQRRARPRSDARAQRPLEGPLASRRCRPSRHRRRGPTYIWWD